jgi:hypothetical protein
MPEKNPTVVRILTKYDGRAQKRLIFHEFLGLKKGEPIGVSLHIMDGDKRDIWTDPTDFVPLSDGTQPIIEEIKALEEQRDGVSSELALLYKKLEKFTLVRPWH